MYGYYVNVFSFLHLNKQLTLFLCILSYITCYIVQKMLFSLTIFDKLTLCISYLIKCLSWHSRVTPKFKKTCKNFVMSLIK